MKKSIISIISFFLLISLLNLNLIFSSAENLENNTLYVDDDSDHDWYDSTHFRSIQDAIDNSSDKDTILIYDGQYFEKIIINKPLNLLGSNNSNIFSNETEKSDIILIYSENTTIQNMNIYYTNLSRKTTGISIHSKNTIIKNCNFLHCGFGIISRFENNKIINCSFNENTNGIKIYSSNNTNISNCQIENSTSRGLIIEGSKNSVVTKNCFKNNYYGLSIEAIIFPSIPEEPGPPPIKSYDNLIYLCNFFNNTEQTYISLYSDNNQFDNGTFGNYWDNYNGTDEDFDGIGDITFIISESNLYDKYPLIEPYKEEPINLIDEDDLLYSLLIGVIISVIFLVPLGIYFRKKYLKY